MTVCFTSLSIFHLTLLFFCSSLDALTCCFRPPGVLCLMLFSAPSWSFLNWCIWLFVALKKKLWLTSLKHFHCLMLSVFFHCFLSSKIKRVKLNCVSFSDTNVIFLSMAILHKLSQGSPPASKDFLIRTGKKILSGFSSCHVGKRCDQCWIHAAIFAFRLKMCLDWKQFLFNPWIVGNNHHCYCELFGRALNLSKV